MKTIILGAGVAGITSAYFLAKAGHEVVVIEKSSESASGCSHANGGQLSFSHAEPWASRSSLSSILKAIYKPYSFISINDLANKDFLKWAYSFAKNSNHFKSHLITERLIDLGRFSRKNLNQILQEEKIDFHYKSDGILHFYRSDKAFKQALNQVEFQKSLGCNLEILSPEECVKKEPTLVKLYDDLKLTGGIFFKDDASGDPLLFIKSLEAICKKKLGVVFEYDAEIKNIFTNYKKVTGINTSKGVFTADNYICALGSYGKNLLKGIKINTKIYPLKGYSLSIPSNNSFLSPNLSLTDPENKIVYSKLGNIFRAAGTIEVCNLRSRDNKKNINFLKNIIKSTYSDFGDMNKAEEWSGFRPYRPDCLPLVCRSEKYGNLFINSGHGSLGWTMSFATSRIIADIILKGRVGEKFKFFEEMEREIYIG